MLKDAHRLILQYMRALLFLCVATLVSFTIALRLMHVPYAILLALCDCRTFSLTVDTVIGLTVCVCIVLNYAHHALRIGKDKASKMRSQVIFSSPSNLAWE